MRNFMKIIEEALTEALMPFNEGDIIEVTTGMHRGVRGIVIGHTANDHDIFAEVISDGLADAWNIKNCVKVGHVEPHPVHGWPNID